MSTGVLELGTILMRKVYLTFCSCSCHHVYSNELALFSFTRLVKVTMLGFDCLLPSSVWSSVLVKNLVDGQWTEAVSDS